MSEDVHWLAYTMGPNATLGALIYDGKDEERMLMEVGRACLSGRRESRIHVYRDGEKYSFVSLNPDGEGRYEPRAELPKEQE